MLFVSSFFGPARQGRVEVAAAAPAVLLRRFTSLSPLSNRGSHLWCALVASAMLLGCGGGGGGSDSGLASASTSTGTNALSSSTPPAVTTASFSAKDRTTLYSSKDIVYFSFNGASNTQISGTVIGTLGEGNTISVELPYGTDRSSLVATFVAQGLAVTINNYPQFSGVSVNNFNVPLVYTVYARDASSKNYTVTINTQTSLRDLYVSPTGSDSNSGTFAQPMQTLEAARTAVRAQIVRGLPAGGITVWLRGGLYERVSTLELGPQDSGTAASPITWRAYTGETPRVVGAKRLNPAWFTPVTSGSPVWNRLDASARGQVVQIDLKARGITDWGKLMPRGFGKNSPAALELFINGKAQPLGRWPDRDDNVSPINSGYTTVNTVVDELSFTMASNRLARWTGAVDAWVHGYWGNDWADNHLSVSAIDTSSRKITFGSKPTYKLLASQPWYAYNLLEEITQPGEWYVDRTSGLLYMWPTAQFNAADVLVSTLTGALFHLNGTTHIHISGLKLEATRASLVTITGGNTNTLSQLVLKNAGTNAVAIRGGTNHRVAQCQIVDPGDEGVIVSGGDRITLVASVHVIEDNEIQGFARFAHTYHPAVSLSGVGQIVRHNLIHDSTHSAIMFTGNEHQIVFNEIRNVLKTTGDAGAIYTGRDWGARGNIISNNFIHHLSTVFKTGWGVHGIYLDDAVSGITVTSNVVYAVDGNAIFHGGGRDNIMANNVLARNGTAIFTDMRAQNGWKAGNTSWLKNSSLLTNLKNLKYQSEPWASRYPDAAAIPNDWAVVTANDGNPWLYPQGNVLARNVGYANTRWINNLASTQWFKEFKDNTSNLDPQFVDEANLDLTLKTSSPAFSIPGFVAPPFKSMGLRAAAMPPSP